MHPQLSGQGVRIDPEDPSAAIAEATVQRTAELRDAGNNVSEAASALDLGYSAVWKVCDDLEEAGL